MAIVVKEKWANVIIIAPSVTRDHNKQLVARTISRCGIYLRPVAADLHNVTINTIRDGVTFSGFV